MSHKITHREYGHGPILVLLHGYGGSVGQWGDVVERLQNDFRVVVPNLSHLYMSKDKLLFSVIVEALATWIRENFPGEGVDLAGMSFGGALAWGVGAKHPSLVNRVVLLNSVLPQPIEQLRLPELRYFFVLPMDAKAVVRLFDSPIGQSFLAKAAEIFRPDREAASTALARLTGRKLEFVGGLVAHFAWILRNEDWKYWQGALAQSKVPTLVVWSEDDALFDENSYRAFARGLPNGQLVGLPSGGHILSQSLPAEVARLLQNFLAAEKLAA